MTDRQGKQVKRVAKGRELYPQLAQLPQQMKSLRLMTLLSKPAGWSLWAFFLTLVLSGCQTMESSEFDAASSSGVQTENVGDDAEESAPVYRSFTEDELYDLLVAEIAGIRGHTELALDNYSRHALASRDPQVVSRAAQIAHFSNRPKELLALSKLWLEIAPDNLDANRVAALALIRNGDLIDAFAPALFSLNAGDSEPIMTLAVFAERAAPDVRGALLTKFPTVETTSDTAFWVVLTEALILRNDGQFERSLDRAGEALKLNPDSETALLLNAQVLHQLGKKERALKLMGDASDADPDNKRLRIQYIRFLADVDVAEARNQLAELVKRYPDDAELSFTLAQSSFELGFFDEARKVLTRLAGYPVISDRAHYLLGQLEESEKNTDAAIAHYQRIRPGDYLVPGAARASALMAEAGDIDVARAYLQKIRLQAPQAAPTIFQMESELLIARELNSDAFGVLSEALERYPNNIQLRYARSIAGERLDRFHQAEVDLRAIIDLDENNAMALNALGYTLTLHTDRYQEAHDLIVRALEIDPDDPAALDSMGWVLYHLGRHEEALAYLQRAFEKLNDPEVAAHLGEVFWATGERDVATEIWQKTLEEHPDNPIILETMERLVGGE
ncbi:MAG: tetratricopeptide repeat protein [bacterium]